MRILFILHQFLPEFSGGTEHVALNLARMAQRAGHRVQVLACGVDPSRVDGEPTDQPVPGCVRYTWEGVPVTLIPRALLPATADISFEVDDALAQQLAAWMDAQRFEVAHVLHTLRMATAVLAAQRCGLPYVLTLTDFFLPCARINLIDAQDRICGGPEGGARCADVCLAAPWTPDGYRQRYEQAAALVAGAAERVAPSRFVAQRFEASFPDSAFKVVPHGIDLIALTNAASRSAGAASRSEGASSSGAGRRGAAGGAMRLLFVGSIVPQKGLHVLLRALAAIPQAEVSLRVVGGFYGNAGYHDELKAMVADDPRVELAGRMDAPGVFEEMKRADLLCIPSQVPESFSLVLNEAAAAGLPALVTDLGASAQRVKDSGAGTVIAQGDVQGWADAISAVAMQRSTLDRWRELLPLPPRIEEEAFFYDALWRRCRRPL